MINELIIKMYRYRYKIIVCLFLVSGLFLTVKSSVVLLGFSFNSRTLDELSIEGLHSGICIKDNLTYTYGILGEQVGRKSTRIYLVDIGSEHNQYMEMRTEQNSFYEKENDIYKLHTYSPGNYRELNSKRQVKLYAVVEKKRILFYDYYRDLFNMTLDDIKKVVSVDYCIRVVNPNDYKLDLICGIFLIACGGIIYSYLYLNKKKVPEIKYNAEQKENKYKPLGLFSRGILEGREILCVEVVLKSGSIVIKETGSIERIVNALDDVTDESENLFVSSGNALYTLIFQLEDCSDLIFEIWDNKRIKSVGGFYFISEDSYKELNNIWKGKSANEKELQS